jgi:glutaredoxin
MGAKQTDSAYLALLKTLDNATPAASQGAPVRLDSVGDPAALRPVADELEARGWLRSSDAPDTYVITEDGRLELVSPLEVTLYTRPGCHLCEEAKAQIAPLLRRCGAWLREVNIDADEVLRERYNVDVPVLFLGARKVAKHRVDPKQFERQLADAARAAKA